MNLFFHHVGQQGADTDFPKTVFNKQAIETVENNLPLNIPKREDLLQQLKLAFPDGTYNCWGVPAGASNVIRSLRVGDAVLLIESTSGSGYIPALAIVKVYWNFELPDLSKAFWGSYKFPYIFFFDTEIIDLTWQEFINHVGYKWNFRPRGKFYRLNQDRLEPYGGAIHYVNFLRKKHRIGNKEIRESSLYDAGSLSLLDDIQQFESEQGFLEKTEKENIVLSRIGQGIFRNKLLRYWKGCAVTGFSDPRMLRASHIKPWKNSTNEERLDTFNGLLLIPNLDTAFDKGLISFTDEGDILISRDLSTAELEILGITLDMNLRHTDIRHAKYLKYHRENIFRT